MGRKLAFSKDAALEQAMESFWAKGYAQTSMRDLAQSLGLHLGSVYNALGDKDAVFEQALKLYIETELKPRLHALATSPDPKAALTKFLHIARDCAVLGKEASDLQNGCFIVNSLMDINRINSTISDIVGDYFKQVEQSLTTCIANGQNAGVFSKKQSAQNYALYIIAVRKSFFLLGKLGQAAMVDAVMACALDTLSSD